MKVVINACFGGFGLSELAFERYLDIKCIEYEKEVKSYGIVCYYNAGFLGNNLHYLDEIDIERSDPALVQVVEEMREEANSQFSSLKIVEIPDDVKWEIQEYDGCESIHEVHRVWS